MIPFKDIPLLSLEHGHSTAQKNQVSLSLDVGNMAFPTEQK